MKKRCELDLTERKRIAEAIVVEGLSVADVVDRTHVSASTVRKWARRYRREGETGLARRSRRPKRIARITPPQTTADILTLHDEGATGKAIAVRLGVSPATVSRILRRAREDTMAAQLLAPVKPQAGGEPWKEHVQRARVVSQASRLLIRSGYEHASLDGVARAAACSKTTLYRLFGDKAGLASAVLRASVESIGSEMVTALTKRGEMYEQLVGFGIAYVKAMQRPVGGNRFYEFGRLAQEVSYRHPEVGRMWFEILEERIARPLASWLRVHVDAGLFRDVDVVFAAHYFCESLVYGGTEILHGQRIEDRPGRTWEDEVRMKVSLFLQGCTAR